MKKLVSSSQAAQILGLSLQGIHYRIKKGQLESIKKDGKTFVYIQTNKKQKNTNTQNINNANSDNTLVLKSKDEQITLLKKTIKYLKKQHYKELQRVEKNQDKILNVFQSEVDLLKSAFTEMKTIYKQNQIDEKTDLQNTTNVTNKNESTKLTMQDLKNFKKQEQYISIKEFYLLLKKYDKTDEDVKKIVVEKIRAKDKRFVYNQNTKEIKILKSDFLDIL
jgi:hypothetical protein